MSTSYKYHRCSTIQIPSTPYRRPNESYWQTYEQLDKLSKQQIIDQYGKEGWDFYRFMYLYEEWRCSHD